MVVALRRKIVGVVRFVREIAPTLLRSTNQKLRWLALQDSGQVTVGAHSYGLPNVLYWDNKTKLEIGKYCSIAEGAVFILGGNHRSDWISTYPFNAFGDKWPEAKSIEGGIATNGDIKIGNDVWIGHGATILSGVSIGNGAIIGAGSVVSGNVEEFAVVAGNPARFIRFRFDENVRAQISKSAWWDWSESRVSNHVKYLMSEPSGQSLFEKE